MDSREIPEITGGDPVLLSLYKRVEEITGIRMNAEQLGRLKKRLEDLGPGAAAGAAMGAASALGTAAGAASDIGADIGREELSGLASCFTVNETYFFREEVHFRLLFRHLLPLLDRRPIRICSAATSSGCEAYSIAMALDFYCRDRLLRGGEPPAWELDAFDLNPEMIDAARRGRYGPNALREDGAGWKPLTDLYLRPGDGDFMVTRILRDKVRFFVHNIMDGLAGSYDIIFFRNTLIYFSPENRRRILGTLSGALRDGGVLIVGVSETSSVEGPEFRMLHHTGAFYFVRETPRMAAEPPAVCPAELPMEPPAELPAACPAEPARPAAPVKIAPAKIVPPETAALIPEIAGILEQDEGRAQAVRVLGFLESGEGDLGFAGLAAAALSLMNGGDLSSAGMVISSLEGRGASPVVSFLRGEFYYQGEEFSSAEAKYQEAAAAENGFWPALYRSASLAEGGNATRYQYRLKKALESMERGAGRGYEVFIGGFSPDYYRRILEKKLPRV
jgi:chemotaxis protein methyltransferase CheR